MPQAEVFNFFAVSLSPYKKFPRVKKKRNGQKKIRWIHAPDAKLKQIQRDILYKVLYRFAAHPCAHAYTAQKNIRSNAVEHMKYAHTIVLDIREFFPSITEAIVRKHLTFYRDKFLKETAPSVDPRLLFCWNSVAEDCVKAVLPPTADSVDLVIDLVCFEGAIPQGAPTSGALSNLVMYPLDCLFEQVAIEKKMAYTRYADDLAFSCDSLEDLKGFVFGYVFRKLQEAGFAINHKKVHVYNKDQRLITGLNVHPEGVRPSRKYRRLLRARLANLRKAILATSTQEALLTELEKHSFLRSEFGHVWYQMYCESYNDGVEKLATSYFAPMRAHMVSLIPELEKDPAALKNLSIPLVLSPAGMSLFTKHKDRLYAMHKEFHKLFFTRYDSKKLQGVLSCGFYGVSKMEGISYREKRNLIAQVLAKPDSGVKGITVAVFQNIYRIAAPEQRVPFLKALINEGPQQRLLWRKLALYTSRLNYFDRLEILRCLAKSKMMETTGAERFVVINHAIKMLRNLNVADLTEFMTCSHSVLRSAAQDVAQNKAENQSSPGNAVVKSEG